MSTGNIEKKSENTENIRQLADKAKAQLEGKRVRANKEMTIDLTPTWQAVVPIIEMGLQHGNENGKKIAHEELVRMAKIADLYNEKIKSREKVKERRSRGIER